jgi:uncharacterized protein (TIGR02996 family)
MSPDERAFIRAVLTDPAEPGPRLVYADWLDEQGDVRGEFLRTEIELAGRGTDDPRHAPLQARLRELRGAIDAGWLALLDRAPVENCHFRFDYLCPRKWESLRTTDDPAVRFCGACEKNVYHCPTVQDAQQHAYLGRCVAVDSRIARAKGDLIPYDLEGTATMTLGIPAAEPPADMAAFVRDVIDRLGRGEIGRPRRRRGRG